MKFDHSVIECQNPNYFFMFVAFSFFTLYRNINDECVQIEELFAVFRNIPYNIRNLLSFIEDMLLYEFTSPSRDRSRSVQSIVDRSMKGRSVAWKETLRLIEDALPYTSMCTIHFIFISFQYRVIVLESFMYYSPISHLVGQSLH